MGEDEALYEAAIGPGWREYYRPRFLALAAGRRLFWNWTAALVPYWTRYRALRHSIWLYVAFLVGGFVIAVALDDRYDARPAALLGYGVMVVLLALVEGALGTWWLFVDTRRRVREVRAAVSEVAQAAERLRTSAPRAGRDAHVVHGVTAMILTLAGLWSMTLPGAWMRFLEAQYRLAMKSDLHNLADAQQAYHDSLGRYAALDSLDFTSSEYVRVTLDVRSPDGYRASAIHRDAPRAMCTIFAGAVPDTQPGAIAGVPFCTRDRGRGP